MSATMQSAAPGGNTNGRGAATSEDGSRAGSAELEREGDAIRADMSRTLDALERKFSPDQMMERSLGFLRENGSNVIHQIGRTARNHPLPILLTAAGVLWLAGSVSQAKAKSTSGNGLTGGALAANGSAGNASMSAAKQKISHSLHEACDQAERVGASVASLVQEQPLVLGALAVAAGALIGAALPLSNRESQLLSELGGQVASKLQQATQS